MFDTAAKGLSADPEGGKALTTMSEIQARARIRSITLDYLNQYFAGGVVSFYELYQAIDNESSWKRNATAEENLNEFKEAMLANVIQLQDLTDVKKPISLDDYQATVRLFHEKLTPLLEARAKSDAIKLSHLLDAYKEYKQPKGGH